MTYPPPAAAPFHRRDLPSARRLAVIHAAGGEPANRAPDSRKWHRKLPTPAVTDTVEANVVEVNANEWR
jgi:hypothetical protein